MPRNKESIIHKYFKYDDDSNECICQIKCGAKGEGEVCYAKIKGRKASNLKTHARTNHPFLYDKIVKIDSRECKSKIGQKTALKSYSRRDNPCHNTENICKQYSQSTITNDENDSDDDDDDDDDDCDDVNDDDADRVMNNTESCDHRDPNSSKTERILSTKKESIRNNENETISDDCDLQLSSPETSKKSSSKRKINGAIDLHLLKKKSKPINYSSYGEHIAQKLGNLPPHVATLCEKVINDILFNAEMGKLKKNIIDMFHTNHPVKETH